jgi:hypothetical protein
MGGLGTETNRNYVSDNPRIDSAKHQKLIKNAQKQIFNKGRAVDGNKVEKGLKDESWTAILVSLTYMFLD